MEPTAVVPKGAPFTDPTRLSVLSYNILAPIYVRPLDSRTGKIQDFAAFEWAEPADQVLDFAARQPRLLQELVSSNADLICLQEVQFEPCPDGGFSLPAWLRLEGYAARLPEQASLEQMAERNERVLGARNPVGNAVLYRADRLEALQDHATDTTTRVSACLKGKGELAGLAGVVVFGVHLDATSEEKRVQQLLKCYEQARAMRIKSVIIAGDMNTECNPGSCVAATLAGAAVPSQEQLLAECASDLRLEGDDIPSELQLQRWEELREQACGAARSHRIQLSRVDTGHTRSSYDHGQKCGPCVPWRLDHMLYSGSSLVPRIRWATLEADPEGTAAGLPNKSCPSDHLPIAASFQVLPVPELPAPEKAALLESTAALQEAQMGQLLELREQQAGLQRELEGAEAGAAPEPPDPDPRQKKKKAKPSPKMIALIQSKRALVRELQQQQRAERAALLEGLGELELDVLEGALGEAHGLGLEGWLEVGTQELKKAAKM